MIIYYNLEKYPEIGFPEIEKELIAKSHLEETLKQFRVNNKNYILYATSHDSFLISDSRILYPAPFKYLEFSELEVILDRFEISTSNLIQEFEYVFSIPISFGYQRRFLELLKVNLRDQDIQIGKIENKGISTWSCEIFNKGILFIFSPLDRKLFILLSKIIKDEMISKFESFLYRENPFQLDWTGIFIEDPLSLTRIQHWNIDWLDSDFVKNSKL